MRINNAVTIPRFHPWNQLAINQLNKQQLTDLLAVDYLTSSVEKCVKITLEVKRKYQQKLVRQVTECPINKKSVDWVVYLGYKAKNVGGVTQLTDSLLWANQML